MTSSPGFFTSAMGLYDPSNPFDSAFKDVSKTFGSTPLKMEENLFGFSPRTSPVPEDRNTQKSNMLDLDGMSLNDHWVSRKDTMLIDPHLRQPAPTTKLDTINVSKTALTQHGQITPPSDSTPEQEVWPQQDTNRRQSLPQPSNTTTSGGGRKKRNSQASTQSEAAPTTRKRRGPSKKAANAATPPQDEKRTKFLERNRVAASKCRQKKKEWTSNLEERARQLQANKTHLTIMASSLRDEVLYLKGEMLEHKNCGCVRIRDYLNREAVALSSGSTTDSQYLSSLQKSPTGSVDPSQPLSMHTSPDVSAQSAASPSSEADLQAMLTAHMD